MVGVGCVVTYDTYCLDDVTGRNVTWRGKCPSRLVIQLRDPGTGTYLLLGTTDSLLSEEWLEDLLYVKQR